MSRVIDAAAEDVHTKLAIAHLKLKAILCELRERKERA